MSFELFTSLFNKVDTITANFITEFTARSIVTITPVVTAGLSLSFIMYGLLIMRGAIDIPITDFLLRSVRISLITSIALAGGLYQTTIADGIRTLPDELITALSNPTEHHGASAAMDQAANQGLLIANEAFNKVSFFGDNGVVYCCFGCIILLTTSVFIAIGGAILLLTKLVLAVLIGLGPIFIIALLWPATAKFFDLWAAQLANYLLLILLFTSLFGLMLSMYNNYLNDIRFDGEQNFSLTLGGAVILSTAMIIVLLQLPALAFSLAGGVSINLKEASLMAQPAKAAYTGGSAIINAIYTIREANLQKQQTIYNKPQHRALNNQITPTYSYYKGKSINRKR